MKVIIKLCIISTKVVRSSVHMYVRVYIRTYCSLPCERRRHIDGWYARRVGSDPQEANAQNKLDSVQSLSASFEGTRGLCNQSVRFLRNESSNIVLKQKQNMCASFSSSSAHSSSYIRSDLYIPVIYRFKVPMLQYLCTDRRVP